MTDDQRPPEEIWLDDEALSSHFDALRDKLRSTGSGESNDEWESVPPAQNELTKDLRKG